MPTLNLATRQSFPIHLTVCSILLSQHPFTHQSQTACSTSKHDWKENSSAGPNSEEGGLKARNMHVELSYAFSEKARDYFPK